MAYLAEVALADDGTLLFRRDGVKAQALQQARSPSCFISLRTTRSCMKCVLMGK